MIKFIGDVYPTKHQVIPLEYSPYLVMNLECAYGKNLTLDKSKVSLISNIDFAKDYQPLCGQLILTLANNHVLDGGKEGVEQLLAYLKEHNIAYCGLGNKENNYHNPYIIEDDSMRIAIISYVDLPRMEVYQANKGYDLAIFTKENYLKTLKIIEGKVDKIVVCMHWGVEESSMPNTHQLEVAKWLQKHGTDCIIGHHTHSIQPWLIEDTKGIFYSLGNFDFSDFSTTAFTTPKNPKGITYRKRQLSWNKQGLVVTYMPKSAHPYHLEQILKTKKGFVSKEMPTYKKPISPRIQLYLRKIFSLVYSNTFTDGKIIDLAYFQNELRLLLEKRKRSIEEK